MTKIQINSEGLRDLYRAKNFDEGSYTTWLSNLISCKDYVGAYIMTIGIVDECRRLGLGSRLLNYTIEYLQNNYTNCEIIYLHVVDYNESAIRFYEKNGFT